MPTLHQTTFLGVAVAQSIQSWVGPRTECGLVAGAVPVHLLGTANVPNCSGRLSMGSPLTLPSLLLCMYRSLYLVCISGLCVMCVGKNDFPCGISINYYYYYYYYYSCYSTVADQFPISE